MFKLALNIILCFLFVQAQNGTTRKPDQVIQLFRHGARAPLEAYDPSWASSDLGRLTVLGLKQQFYLGKNISELYPELVGSTYSPDNISVLANNVNRCIDSAIVQLSTLYLGKNSTLMNDSNPQEIEQSSLMQQLDDHLPESEKFSGDVVPVQVDVVDSTNEIVFLGQSPQYCPNLNTWIGENHNDARAQEIWSLFSDSIATVNKNLSEEQQITHIDNEIIFADVLVANLAANKAIPGDVTDPTLIHNLTYALGWFIFHNNQAQEIQKQLTSFNTFQAFLGQLASFREGQQDAKKLAFYSGHDTNLISILGALGILSDDCLEANFKSFAQNQTLVYPNCYFPYYSSDIIIELYNRTVDPYVKFYYNNVSISLCNNENATCSYQDFVALINNVTGNTSSETYQLKCNSTSDGKKKEIHALFFFGFIVLTVAFSLKFLNQKKDHYLLPVEKQGADAVTSSSSAVEEEGGGGIQ